MLNQPDFFDKPDYQDVYRELLQKSWDESLRIIRDRGEVPPWVETDFLLQEDEIRLLQAIGDGYPEGERVTVQYPDGRVRRVSTITRDAGFNAEVNATAVIRRCISLGYIRREINGHSSTLYVTDEGAWRLDAVLGDRIFDE